MLACGPGPTAAGKVSHAIIDFSDFLPTLAELGGDGHPVGRVFNGVSFADLLLGKSFRDRDWSHCYYNPRKNRWKEQWFAGTKEYKLYGDDTFCAVAAHTLQETVIEPKALTEAQKAERDKLEDVIDEFTQS